MILNDFEFKCTHDPYKRSFTGKFYFLNIGNVGKKGRPLSISTSSNIIIGLLPPSSNETGCDGEKGKEKKGWHELATMILIKLNLCLQIKAKKVYIHSTLF